MKEKFKRVLDFLKANDADSYRVRKALKKAERHANDAEGDKEDSGWRTTENGKHYHIGEGGEIDKGPKAMVGSNVNKPSTWNGGSSTKPASQKPSNASMKTSSKAKEAVMSIQRELMSPGKPALSDFAKKIKERIDAEKGEVSKENLEKIISEEAGKIVTRSDSGILRTNPYYTQKGDEYGTIAASGMQQAISKLNKELGINASIPSEKAKGSSGLTKEQMEMLNEGRKAFNKMHGLPENAEIRPAGGKPLSELIGKEYLSAEKSASPVSSENEKEIERLNQENIGIRKKQDELVEQIRNAKSEKEKNEINKKHYELSQMLEDNNMKIHNEMVKEGKHKPTDRKVGSKSREEIQKEFDELPTNSIVSTFDPSLNNYREFKKVKTASGTQWIELKKDGSYGEPYDRPVLGLSNEYYGVKKGKLDSKTQKAVNALKDAPVGAKISFNEGTDKVTYVKNADGSWENTKNPFDQYREEQYEAFIATTEPEAVTNGIEKPNASAQSADPISGAEEGAHLSAPNYSVQSLQDVKNAEIGSTINLPGMPEGSRVWTKWYDGWVSEGGSNISDEEMWDGGNGFIDGADPIQIEPPKESSDPFWQQNVPNEYEDRKENLKREYITPYDEWDDYEKRFYGYSPYTRSMHADHDIRGRIHELEYIQKHGYDYDMKKTGPLTEEQKEELETLKDISAEMAKQTRETLFKEAGKTPPSYDGIQIDPDNPKGAKVFTSSRSRSAFSTKMYNMPYGSRVVLYNNGDGDGTHGEDVYEKRSGDGRHEGWHRIQSSTYKKNNGKWEMIHRQDYDYDPTPAIGLKIDDMLRSYKGGKVENVQWNRNG